MHLHLHEDVQAPPDQRDQTEAGGPLQRPSGQQRSHSCCGDEIEKCNCPGKLRFIVRTILTRKKLNDKTAMHLVRFIFFFVWLKIFVRVLLSFIDNCHLRL